MKLHRECDDILKSVKKIHMIGIGGSGMCPLAEILHSKGYILSGSDNNESDPLKRVIALGIPVSIGHKAENVQGAELVVYSAAISNDNPELVAAKKASAFSKPFSTAVSSSVSIPFRAFASSSSVSSIPFALA